MSNDPSVNSENPNEGSRIEQRASRARRAWRLSTYLFVFVVLAVVACASSVSVYIHRLSVASGDHDSEPHSPNTPAETSSETELQSITADLRRKFVESRIAALRTSLKQVHSLRDECSQKQHQLLHGDAGRQLATHDPSVLRMIALFDLKPETLEVTLNDVDRLEQDLSLTSASGFSNVLESVEVFQQRAESQASYYTNWLRESDQIQQAAVRFPRSTVTLNEVIQCRETKVADARREAAAKEAASAEAAFKQTHDKTNSAIEKLNADLSALRKQLSEAAQHEDPAENTGPDSPHPPAALRVQYLHELPDHKPILRPFITSGYSQPLTADEFVYQREKHPVSYESLRRIGALNDSKEGWQILFRIGGSRSSTNANDRPLGLFPRMNSDDDLQRDSNVKRQVRQAQQFLATYGPLLVADGLLSP